MASIDEQILSCGGWRISDHRLEHAGLERHGPRAQSLERGLERPEGVIAGVETCGGLWLPRQEAVAEQQRGGDQQQGHQGFEQGEPVAPSVRRPKVHECRSW